MDLTKHPPRSPRALLAGAAGLARTTDKARAFLNGTLGEFHYGYECPHDWAVFDALGIDGAKFTTMVERLKTDEAVASWVHEAYLSRLPDGALEQWNAAFVNNGIGTPPLVMLSLEHPLRSINSDTFVSHRERIAPSRTEITRFVDRLDLEDGREPQIEASP